MEVAPSVEGRVPFLDHKVVGVVGQMPVDYKIKAMKERFTAVIYLRQKHPFMASPSTGSLPASPSTGFSVR